MLQANCAYNKWHFLEFFKLEGNVETESVLQKYGVLFGWKYNV